MASIIRYAPKYAAEFAALNLEWLTTYFKVESQDYETFKNIDEAVLKNGGEIFMCLNEEDIVVGTVAMQTTNGKIYKLAKMAVSPHHQGKGYANLLMEACIAFAKEKKADKIMLLSNTILAPAIQLYRKYGFVEVQIEDNQFERTNIQMELIIES